MSLIETILGPKGSLSQALTGFTYRPEQMTAARVIEQSFTDERICLVEAGTGVGKTMAYLVPALEQIRNQKRVVISTHTLNLQGQLVSKDIPLLQRIAGDPEFEAVLVKGMGNYLCRFNLEYESGQTLIARDETFQRIQAWAEETTTGDVAELPFSARGWSDLSCDRDTCHRSECRYYDECFYYGMRRSAEKASLIVANHALFLSDLVIRMADPGAGILPPYDFVVFDEAHRLEEVASRVFGIEYSNYRIPTFLNRLRRIRGVPVDLGILDSIESLNASLFELVAKARRQEFFLEDAFNPVEMGELNGRASELCILLEKVHADLLNQARNLDDTDETVRDRLEGYARTCARLYEELQQVVFEKDDDWFVWGERPAAPGRLVKAVLHRTPVHVSEILSEKFWGRLKGAALVSATLSNSGGFTYARSRLGIPEANEVVVGSPFDFKKQCLLYVPAHLPFPSDSEDYLAEMSTEIGRILRASSGRAFLLFTSYRMLDRVYQELASRLDYPLLRQGQMPNQALLAKFRQSPGACLFGTSSFWEGVDVQGEALSCVIIDKLPFSVPDTPVSRARMDAVEKEGGNPFADLSVPEAQIRLKQGFGRLIRTQSDRGVVAIFDSRLVKKSYGRSFLQVLPPARMTRSIVDVEEFFDARASCGT